MGEPLATSSAQPVDIGYSLPTWYEWLAAHVTHDCFVTDLMGNLLYVGVSAEVRLQRRAGATDLSGCQGIRAEDVRHMVRHLAYVTLTPAIISIHLCDAQGQEKPGALKCQLLPGPRGEALVLHTLMSTVAAVTTAPTSNAAPGVSSAAPAYLMARYDQQRRHLSATASLCTYLTCAEHNLIGRTSAEAGLPEVWCRLIDEGLDHALLQRSPWCTSVVLNADHHWTIHAVPEGSADHPAATVLWCNTTADINARRELADAVAQWRALADAMPQLVWMADARGKVFYYNERARQYRGIRREHDGEWDWTPMIHPDDVSDTEAVWRLAHKHGRHYAHQHRLCMQDGTYRWHLSRANPELDSQGRVVKWYGTATDISDQVHTQQLLKEQADELARLVTLHADEYRRQQGLVEAIWSASVDIVAVYDRDARLVSLNKKIEEQLGMKREEVIGRKVTELFPTAYVLHDELHRALQGEFVFNPRYRSVTTGRYYENYITPLRDEHHGIYGALVSSRDITETFTSARRIQKSSEQLQQMNETLLRKNLELEQFAYIASHDLQEPLRKIATFSRLLESVLNDDHAKARIYLDKIMASSMRMSDLIGAVLRYSQLDQEESFVSTDLNDILQQVRDDLEVLISDKHALIESEVLPTIEAVPAQMVQLLYNLLANALKFSRAGAVCVITIRHEINDHGPGAPRHQMTISDNGIGFNPAYADKIFGMFQRLNGRDQYTGAGIGLALCKKIVENHGGEIYADSAEGVGTTVTVILPETQGGPPAE